MLVELPIPDERQQRLADLLNRAIEAHKQYEEVILKRPDPNWARWVAGFVLERGVGKDLAREMTEGQLAERLAKFDLDYLASADGQPRQDYLVNRLSQLIGWPEPTA